MAGKYLKCLLHIWEAEQLLFHIGKQWYKANNMIRDVIASDFADTANDSDKGASLSLLSSVDAHMSVPTAGDANIWGFPSTPPSVLSWFRSWTWIVAWSSMLKGDTSKTPTATLSG